MYGCLALSYRSVEWELIDMCTIAYCIQVNGIEDALYYWIPPEIADLSKVKVHIPSHDLCPNITTPLLADAKPSLSHMIDLLSVCLKHNFPSAALVLGATVLSFHFEKAVELFRSCPICVCVGPPRDREDNSYSGCPELVRRHRELLLCQGDQCIFPSEVCTM